MRVLVAMSGGVDSSVAAAELVEAGHEVVGATLKLWGGSSDAGCCSVGDVEDARRVAQVLGIDHHVFSYAEEFSELVVAPYVAAHAAGLTPNPCVECNRRVKFDLLAERARRLGFDALATGHHARVRRRDGRSELLRGRDANKDQSYVLARIAPRALDDLLLPVGEMAKEEVRTRAEARGLRTWAKPDSQDLCFVGADAGRAGFLGERLALTRAEIVDARSGEVLGETDGAELMTVGQRRGVLPGRDGERRYVVRVDLAARRVEVGGVDAVTTRRIDLAPDSVGYLGEPVTGPRRVVAQWSAHGRPSTGTLRPGANPFIELDEPRRAVAPGQVVVWYRAEDPEVVEGAALAAS